MTKYNVKMSVTGFVEIAVDAEDLQEAREKAYAACDQLDFGALRYIGYYDQSTEDDHHRRADIDEAPERRRYYGARHPYSRRDF